MEKARTRKETIAILQQIYPKFSKATMSMVLHPEKYGICLTKEAKKALGLETKKQARKKSHQITVRLSDSLYDQLMCFCETNNMTTQRAVEALIKLGTRRV